jgi:hypothetical protein
MARTGSEIELMPADSIDAEGYLLKVEAHGWLRQTIDVDRIDQIVWMTPGNRHTYLLKLLPGDRVRVLVDNVHGAHPAFQVMRTIAVTVDGQLEISSF